MSYLPKSVVENNIKRRVRKDRKGGERISFEAYFGTDPFSKAPVRKTRNTIEELKKDIKDFFLRHQAGGDAAVRLNPMQALDARNALDELAMAKVTMSLTDVVRAFLDGSARIEESGNDKTLGEACQIGTRLAASVICTSENVCPRFLPGEFGLDIEVQE